MNTQRHAISGLLFSLLVLAGCAGMGEQTPRAALGNANQLAASTTLGQAAVSGQAWPAIDWWTHFEDPQLNQLIDEALAGNPSLRQAQARVRKAAGLAKTAGAPLDPQVNVDGQSTRERFSEHGIFPPPFAGKFNTLSQLETTVNWDLDLAGKNRAAYESALGQAKATQIDAFAARLSLSAAVAQSYVQLQRAYLQLDVANDTLKQREQIYTLTRDRVDAGVDSNLELRQAEAALPETREKIAQLNESVELTRNQLAALLGAGPDRGISITRPAAQALPTLAIPATLPANLLGRRPDIAAQRWRVEAAAKDIAVAKAEFYPDVSLTAFLGLQNLGPTALFQAANKTLGVGPALTLPIFDGGRLRGNLAGKDADYDIAVEQYNQTLVDALHEVVDQLTSLRSLSEQHKQQQQALTATRQAYDLAVLRYRDGVGNYLQVLSAESQLLEQQSLEVDLRARDLSLSINLMRALGGGFDTASAPLALN